MFVTAHRPTFYYNLGGWGGPYLSCHLQKLKIYNKKSISPYSQNQHFKYTVICIAEYRRLAPRWPMHLDCYRPSAQDPHFDQTAVPCRWRCQL